MPGEFVKNADSYHLSTKILMYKILWLSLGIFISTDTQVKQMWVVHGPQVEKHQSELKLSAASNAAMNGSCLQFQLHLSLVQFTQLNDSHPVFINPLWFLPPFSPQLCPHHYFHLQCSSIPISSFHPCSYLPSRLKSLIISSLRYTFQIKLCGRACFFKSFHWKAHTVKVFIYYTLLKFYIGFHWFKVSTLPGSLICYSKGKEVGKGEH